MKTKRYWSKAFKILMTIAVLALVIAAAYNVFYNNIVTDDTTKQQNYEVIQKKHKFLKEIAKDSIEEGKRVEINKLSREGIQYKIYNDGENIIIYYYIDEKIGDEYPYNATISLSNDYKIIDEQYAEKEDFEAYKKRIEISEKMISLTYALMTSMVLYFVFWIFWGVYCVIRLLCSRIIKKKDESKTINNHSTQEMRKNYAGKYIENPEELPNGSQVTVFDKSSDNWWEHGDICTRKDGTKVVNCWDGTYELDEVEVYLDTRYS